MIIPDAILSLSLADKDKNEIFRMVAYTEQLEDVIKAARRLNYTTKEFSYDKQKWLDDGKQKQILEQNLQNSITELN